MSAFIWPTTRLKNQCPDALNLGTRILRLCVKRSTAWETELAKKDSSITATTLNKVAGLVQPTRYQNTAERGEGLHVIKISSENLLPSMIYDINDKQ